MKNRLIPLSFCLLLSGCVYTDRPQSDVFMQSDLMPPKEVIDIAPQMQPEPTPAPQQTQQIASQQSQQIVTQQNQPLVLPQQNPPIVVPQQTVLPQHILAPQTQNPTPFVQTIVIPQAAPVAYPAPVSMPPAYPSAPIAPQIPQMQQVQPVFTPDMQQAYNQQMYQQPVAPTYNQPQPAQLQQPAPQPAVISQPVAQQTPPVPTQQTPTAPQEIINELVIPQIEPEEVLKEIPISAENIYPSWARPATNTKDNTQIPNLDSSILHQNQINIPRW